MGPYLDAQLDLFLDNGPSELERELINALSQHRFEAARTALDSLMTIYPQRDDLQAFATLIREGYALFDFSLEPRTYLTRLECQLIPQSRVLGPLAPVFLKPLWQRLAQRLHGQPFETTQPHLHSSYAALQAGDWSAVRSAIEREPGWQTRPPLVAWRMEAALQLAEHSVALGTLCRLCWVFPEELEATFEPMLTRWFDIDYREFRDLEVELSLVDFPAWYALRHQRTLPIPPDLTGHGAAETAMAVNGVLTEFPGTPDADARRRLRQSHPTLFRLFMAQRRLQSR